MLIFESRKRVQHARSPRRLWLVAASEGPALQTAALHHLVLSVQSSRERLGGACVDVAPTTGRGRDTHTHTHTNKVDLFSATYLKS
jgi:hypothetical protein